MVIESKERLFYNILNESMLLEAKGDFKRYAMIGGDDEYDCCDIQCGERLCGDKDDDIKKCFINPDDYENFLKIKN